MDLELTLLSNKMIHEKRGLSAVVATMLLILLTVVSVVLVASFILPFINDSLKSTDCFKFKEYFVFDNSFDLNCYEKDASGQYKYKLSVKTQADNSNADKVIGFNLRFLGNGKGSSIIARDGEFNSDLTMLAGVAGEPIKIPISGGKYPVLSYIYTSSEEYKKAGIYTVIEDGRICDESDLIELKRC